MGLVYRSVDDIGGLVHVHAPTVDLFHIGVGWVYGLDEDCSLKVVGMGIGLGDKVFDINFDHLLDEDGLQCETRQVIALNAPKPAPQPTAKPLTAPIKTPSPRTYTKYSNKQCEGTNTDILRDFDGTVAACEAKCDEVDCIGFIRVQSTGRCYFRGGEMNRPYDYTSDERDCYIPVDEVDSILFDGGDESFDAAPGFKIADIPITDSMTFSMDITINSLYNRPEGGDQNAVLFECKNKADTQGWV